MMLVFDHEHPEWTRDPQFWRAFLKAKDQLPLLSLPNLFHDDMTVVTQDIDLIAQLMKYDQHQYFMIPDDNALKNNERDIVTNTEIELLAVGA